jgi:drug/metabolite transporter (DMT)-like permease
MRLGPIGHLVAHARGQYELPAIGELGMQLPSQAEQDVAFAAPVIGPIAWRVLHHADADRPKLTGSPLRPTGFARMPGGLNRRPVGCAKCNVMNVHGSFLWKTGFTHSNQVLGTLPAARLKDLRFVTTPKAHQSASRPNVAHNLKLPQHTPSTMTVEPWYWIVFTVAAAAAQSARNAMQRELTSVLGTAGATQVRFFYGLPFALVFLVVVLLVTGEPLPQFSVSSVGWTGAGAVAQAVATALMLAAMREKSFVVTTALIKSEPVWVALLGLTLLGETLGLTLATGISVATAGVLWLSWPAAGSAWALRPVALGLASAAIFAASSIAYRAAFLALPGDPGFVIAATAVLALSLAMQVALLLTWILIANRSLLIELLRVWRPSLATGFLAATGSQFWLLAFAIESPARIRTLALIEIVFAQIISRKIFSQRQSSREIIGVTVLLIGVVIVLRD